MEDDLMFSMEEEEASAQRPPAPCRGASQRTRSPTKSSASDDDEDEEDHVIRPILDDSAKEICHYLKDLVSSRQLPNSLPKSSFSYRVSWGVRGRPTTGTVRVFTCTCSPTLVRRCGTDVKASCFQSGW